MRHGVRISVQFKGPEFKLTGVCRPRGAEEKTKQQNKHTTDKRR